MTSIISCIIISALLFLLLTLLLHGERREQQQLNDQKRDRLKQRAEQVVYYDRYIRYHQVAVSIDQLDSEFGF